jgi:hypothetical protein
MFILDSKNLWDQDVAERYVRECFDLLEGKVKMVFRPGKAVPDVEAVTEPLTDEEISHLTLTLYWANHHLKALGDVLRGPEAHYARQCIKTELPF